MPKARKKPEEVPKNAPPTIHGTWETYTVGEDGDVYYRFRPAQMHDERDFRRLFLQTHLKARQTDRMKVGRADV